MSEERRFFSSVWRSERMPIVTLSKSMSRAAFGAWWEVANAAGDIAWGPRCIGAIAPALVLTLLWSGTVSTVLPFVTGQSAWDSVAASGERAIAAARQAPLTPSQRRAVDAHERELRTSVEQARRYSFLAERTVRVIAIAGVLALLILTGAASRVAGHLSRQLSRTLGELVRWSDLIGHGETLPPQ